MKVTDLKNDTKVWVVEMAEGGHGYKPVTQFMKSGRTYGFRCFANESDAKEVVRAIVLSCPAIGSYVDVAVERADKVVNRDANPDAWEAAYEKEFEGIVDRLVEFGFFSGSDLKCYRIVESCVAAVAPWLVEKLSHLSDDDRAAVATEIVYGLEF